MSIHTIACAYMPRETKLNLVVAMGKTMHPSFSRRASKRSSVQKSNSVVSSNADSEVATIVAPLTT